MEEKKSILIIGANSYIARNLIQHVKEKKPDWTIEAIESNYGKWKQKKDYSGYDAVVIAAALVHKKETPESEADYQKINCDMPVAIAHIARKSGVSQVVFLSSMAIFGSHEECITMQTKPRPETFYGKYKFRAEEHLQKLARSDFSIAIVRPPMVYGKGCPGNYGRLEKLASHSLFFPDTQNKRSVISIENLCKELIEILESGKGGYYHPQDSSYMNTAEIVKQMRSEMGKKTILIHFLNWLIIPLSHHIGIFRKVFGNLWYE